MTKSNTNALIVEGGAMRSVFSAGLLDGFLEREFNPFDFYIGVSAGSFNVAAYLAGTPGKSLAVFRDFALRRNFISYSRFMRGGHLLDLDWLFDETLGKSYLDLKAVYSHGKPLYVCVTDVGTGGAVYLNTSPDNLKTAIKASSAVPLFYRNFPIVAGRAVTDGGVADGIPLAQAIHLGAKRIMVIRSRSKAYLKKDSLVHRIIRWKLRRHPMLTATMRARVKTHADVIHMIRNPPPGVEIVEICPSDDFIMGRFSRQRKRLLDGYAEGFTQANEAIERWISVS
jgi:predicted patatin/cPLA2 family phospholipase